MCLRRSDYTGCDLTSQRLGAIRRRSPAPAVTPIKVSTDRRAALQPFDGIKAARLRKRVAPHPHPVALGAQQAGKFAGGAPGHGARLAACRFPYKDLIPIGRRGGVQPPTRRPWSLFAAARGPAGQCPRTPKQPRQPTIARLTARRRRPGAARAFLRPAEPGVARARNC